MERLSVKRRRGPLSSTLRCRQPNRAFDIRCPVCCWLGKMEGDGMQPRAASAVKERQKVDKKRQKKLPKAAVSSKNGTTDTPGTPTTPPRHKKRRKKLAKAASLSSTNCTPSKPNTPPSEGHISVAAKAEEAAVISGKKRPRERAAGGKPSSVFTHPFPTEYGDHFETPLQAYRDVEGALALLAKLLGKKRQHLRIWDPYVSESGSHYSRTDCVGYAYGIWRVCEAKSQRQPPTKT